MGTTAGERRLGVVLAVGFLAMQLWITIAAFGAGVSGAWVAWIRFVLIIVLLAETVSLWQLLGAGRSAVAYVVAFGGVAVVAVLVVPLIVSW